MKPMHNRRKWRSRAAKKRHKENAPVRAWNRLFKIYKNATSELTRDLTWHFLSMLKHNNPDKLSGKELPGHEVTLVVKSPRYNAVIYNAD